MAGAMVAVVLAGVMFPLWPLPMRIGVWYLSMGVLGLIGLFFATAIVRLILWCVTVVVLKPGIWLFPNLFADVGFVSKQAHSLSTLSCRMPQLGHGHSHGHVVNFPLGIAR